jgi:catechol 2,3-dioxygenase-like lactoylglutathione lyase family enzyme
MPPDGARLIPLQLGRSLLPQPFRGSDHARIVDRRPHGEAKIVCAIFQPQIAPVRRSLQFGQAAELRVARLHDFLAWMNLHKERTTCRGYRSPSREGQKCQGSINEEAVVNERNPHSGSAFQAIRAIDYSVIFVRDMAAMRSFYEDILGFPLLRELSPGWIEYRVGGNTLALARPSLTAADAPTPSGSASLQLAFKVSAPEVDQCADELARQGVDLLSPPTDRAFGHRTLFFRDPDGNLLEVFADI